METTKREIDYYLVNKECWGWNGKSLSKGVKMTETQYPDTLKYLKEIGLLINHEYFTPVYKENKVYKKGDKVIASIVGVDVLYYGTYKEKDGNKHIVSNFCVVGKGINFCDGLFDIILRHATPSEIAESERPKVGDYCKNIWNDGDVSYYHIRTIRDNLIYDDEYYNLKSGGNIIVTNKSDSPCAYFGSPNYKIEVITKAEFDEVKQRYLASQKIMIGGKYEVKFLNNAAKDTNIEGNLYTKDFWKCAFEVSEHTKASVVVGCNAKGLGTHKWEVTQEQIEKILSKLK